MLEEISKIKSLISLSLCLSLFILSASCLSKPINVISDCLAYNANMQEDKPVPTINFPQQSPASAKPILTWTKVKGAVAFELELLHTLPENAETTMPYPNCFYSTKNVYVNGFNANLPPDLTDNFFYWRVRGLGMDGNPISDFSDAEKVYVDYQKDVILKPIPTSIFNQSNGATLLYPVYAWIPISGAEKYEVEILDDVPENPNGIDPSEHRIDSAITTGSEYYDEKPRISEDPFYWRVRGLDQDGNPIGVYSDAGQFITNPTTMYFAVATFGNSITHGGGGMSYSPADWEYSYQYYLDFPTINLGRSGDTTQTMVERFDDDVLPFSPQYLIILAGTNSLRGGVPAEDVIADLLTLKKKCLKNSIRPVFLTIPPINPDNIKRAFDEPTASDWQEQIQIVNDFIQTQVHIDITRDMDSPDGVLPTELAVDGLHLDIDGKKLMASAINADWPRIESLSWRDWV